MGNGESTREDGEGRQSGEGSVGISQVHSPHTLASDWGTSVDPPTTTDRSAPAPPTSTPPIATLNDLSSSNPNSSCPHTDHTPPMPAPTTSHSDAHPITTPTDPPITTPIDPSPSTTYTSPPTADGGPDQTHGPNTPAARAFRKCYADLAAGIPEPLSIAASLYSTGYITRETRDRVFLPTHTTTERNLVLLDAVERRVFTEPSNLWTLVAIMEKDTTMKTFASRLRSAYGELCGSPPETPAICSPAIARYADYLRAYYRTAPIAHDNKLVLEQAKVFVNLALVKKKKVNRAQADEFTKATLHGQVDTVYRQKQPVSLDDVLKPEEGQEEVKCVLVEGPPGVGKSTFAWELCRMWDEIEAMRQYSLVVLLRLREKRIQQARTVADLFYYLFDASLQQAVAEDVLSRQGAQTLLVLDGFDEASSSLENDSLILRILQGTCLSKVTVLVTSRPSARAQLLSVDGLKVSKHIEILGFLHDQIRQYAHSRFSDITSLRDDFLKYISCSPAIGSMLYIPLSCAIVAEVYQANRSTGRPIPRTMTQLYTDLTLTLMRRHLRGKGDHSLHLLPGGLDSLPRDLDHQLSSLADLAYQGILKQEVIFPNLPEGCSHLDMMTASSELYLGKRGSVSYSFIHLTLQEFLAALHVSRLSHSEQKVALELYSDKEAYPHMDVVWRFVAGLTHFTSIGLEVVMARRGRDELGQVLPFLVECLYETQEEATCQEVLGEGEVRFRGYVNCTVFDFFAVGYCVSVSKCSWYLQLGENPHGPDAVEMLVSGIKSREEVHGTITNLNLGGNLIKKEGIAHLKEMPHKIPHTISYLNLQSCDLDNAGLDLLSDIIATMTSLKELNISFNKPGAGGAVKLLMALANLSSLETLIMSYTNIGCEDIQALSHLIRPSGCTQLKGLEIGDESMSPECVELMMTTLLFPSSLETLTVWRTNLTGSHNCFSLLEQNSNLQQLHLMLSPIGSRTTSSLARSLHTKCTMDRLTIISHSVPVTDQIGTEGALALSQTLQSNKTLKGLWLQQDQSIGEAGARALVNALQYNHTLELLLLPQDYSRYFPSEKLDSRVDFLM